MKTPLRADHQVLEEFTAARVARWAARTVAVFCVGWVWVVGGAEHLRAAEPDTRAPELVSRTGGGGADVWNSPEELAAAAIFWLADESGPVSGQVVDLEQYPAVGRNLPKTIVDEPPPRP